MKSLRFHISLCILVLSNSALIAQWHPIGPEKVQGQEAFLFFYDYFFEAQKTEEISIYQDSVFYAKLDKFRFERPSYVLEVYLPQNGVYRYYCLRSRADGQGNFLQQEIWLVEFKHKGRLKELVKEEQHKASTLRKIPASIIPESYFYSDQFYFSQQTQLVLDSSRIEQWQGKKLDRNLIVEPFIKLINEDLKSTN